MQGIKALRIYFFGACETCINSYTSLYLASQERAGSRDIYKKV